MLLRQHKEPQKWKNGKRFQVSPDMIDIPLSAALKMTVLSSALLGASDVALAEDMSISRTIIQGGLSGVLSFCLFVVWRAFNEEREKRMEESKTYADKLEKAQEKFIEHLKHERRD